jgi:RNA polymerase sigma factor (sigma-70 family)
MQDKDDMELVREYATQGSEAAFEVLVRRHADLVYSTALRQVRDPQVAEEVAQSAFIILARKAGSLRRETILPGWLFKAARFAAADALKAAARRQRREQAAHMDCLIQQEPAGDAAWEQIAPLLDEAMAHLGESDRNAVILRFFKNQPMREVGVALGIKADTAQMRVTRALEKLRSFLVRRGVMLSAGVIAGAISANSVQGAPATLVTSVAAVVAAQGATTGGSVFSLGKGGWKFMFWSHATKMAVVAGVAILLAVGTGVMAVRHLLMPGYVRIEGTARVELYTTVLAEPTMRLSAEEEQQVKADNAQRKVARRVVETARFVILTDGKSYRISMVSKGGGTFTNDAYDVTSDYGSDGQDTFVVSDQVSLNNRKREGWSGFVSGGRVPDGDRYIVPPAAQAVWLAYCAGDYFNLPEHRTGLKKGAPFSTIWPGYVTNLVTYWPGTTLPQSITGWSRNAVLLPRTNSEQPREIAVLGQYPGGFKAWTFTASDPVVVGNLRVPRRFTRESFFPKPPNTATTGDETEPTQITTFVADAITPGKGRLEPVPPVPVPDLRLMDWRFEDVAGPYVITTHATRQGWPTRGSPGFKDAAAQASRLAAQNPKFVAAALKKEAANLPPP